MVSLLEWFAILAPSLAKGNGTNGETEMVRFQKYAHVYWQPVAISVDKCYLAMTLLHC
jgi:hypothetical protein